MNYAVMYEYAVDRNSGQFKAPFNQIKNEARVYTYKDTAVITPNSDTPYSLLWLDLRAEPIVLSVPAVEKKSLLFGDALRRQHLSTTDTSVAARPAARPGTIMVVGPDWKGGDAAGHQEGLSVHDASFSSLPTARNFSMPQTCRMLRRSRPATRCSRCLPI